MKYHLVLVSKDCNKCFTSEILESLEFIFVNQCEKWGVDLLEFRGEADHVHLFLGFNPTIAPSKFINSLKTVSSRLVRKKYSEHLKQHYLKPVMWSRAYCLLTTGAAPIEVLKEYFLNQNRPT
jgi:putative transposase